jgi:ankyrin repeat protein
LDNLCKQRSDRDIQRELQSLPSGLDETYNRILLSINRKTRALRILAQNCIRWIIYALRPLRYEELIEAAAMLDSTCKNKSSYDYAVDVILEACSNLIVQENGLLRPIHYSVQEYLTSPPSTSFVAKDPEWWKPFNMVHRDLARACIFYLNYHYNGVSTRYFQWHDCDERIRANPFSWYSARHFHKHLNLLGDLSSDFDDLSKVVLDWGPMTCTSLAQIRCLSNAFDSTVNYQDFESSFDSILTIASFSRHELLPDCTFFVHNSRELYWSLCFPEPHSVYQAAHDGNLAAIKTWLSGTADASLNNPDHFGMTILSRAANKGRCSTIQYLLEHGADVNSVDRLYGNALQAAILGWRVLKTDVPGDKMILSYVTGELHSGSITSNISASNDPKRSEAKPSRKPEDSMDNCSVETHSADNYSVQSSPTDYNVAGYNSSDIYSADKHPYDEPEGMGDESFEYDPMSFQSTVELLLSKGADVNAAGGLFGSPLQACIGFRQEEVTDLLLERGADVNLLSGYFGAALQAAAYIGDLYMTLKLLNAGAKTNTRSGHFGTAFIAASYRNNREVWLLLLDTDADINLEAGFYHTALQAAAAGNSKTMVEILLEEGANIHASGGHYGNALQAAAREGNKEIVSLLLAAGADINARGGHYGTALQAAAAGGYKVHLDVVELLLKMGAKIHCRGGFYGSAMKAARKLRHQSIVEILERFDHTSQESK